MLHNKDDYFAKLNNDLRGTNIKIGNLEIMLDSLLVDFAPGILRAKDILCSDLSLDEIYFSNFKNIKSQTSRALLNDVEPFE